MTCNHKWIKPHLFIETSDCFECRECGINISKEDFAFKLRMQAISNECDLKINAIFKELWG